MGVFRCEKGDGTWENLEAPHETLADLYAQLATTGLVLGSILLTRRGSSPREREVTGRLATIVTPRTYTKISDCTISFVE